jgi:hypothetical protein
MTSPLLARLLEHWPGGAWRARCTHCDWVSPRQRRLDDPNRLFVAHYLTHLAAGEVPPLPSA